MKASITSYDTSEYLKDDKDIAGYLEAIMRENPALFHVALGDVARALGMAELAERTGLSRETLYHSLSKDDDLRYSTVCKILSACGVNHIKFGSSVPSDNTEAVVV
ncbi:MAG: putative addiction module antidote protein [Coriobacteriia bacterium]|nr:putative addiction module antidote protein [Coriobacteriia bacterium]MCL2870015.1 putative addiction module antidote protein [Coriobacteriia bacterium]